MARRLNFRRKKKVRGVRRRLQEVIGMPRRFGGEFPERNRWGYLDFKLPVDQSLIEGSHVRLTHLKQCAQALLDLCYQLKQHVPDGAGSPPLVVASICMPNMFSSRVTIFWDAETYRKFFSIGELLPDTECEKNSLVKSWQLNDHGLSEACVLNKVFDGKVHHESKIWLFGG